MSGWIECATPGCPGDMRYAAPGRGHIPGCTAPVTASDARPPSDTGTTHDIEVSGIWFNTGDAGVGVWCHTCADWILEGDDYGDVLTPEQITSAVAAHAGQEQP